ncbi:NAD(P)/FAD-dependent oxidoreductase [Patescibacteria group bacterium]|jgi:all-trans-retinol 13,14-reductase|nr:NAD(P)/FAD-dependent oxidoreductase [Patescibacteria group bacterium]
MPGLLYHTFKGHNDQYDAIVIGSGIGGLSVASLLSRQGKKVLMLERHYEIGGYTHAFKRKGYQWDVGLHYVGQVHIEGSTLNKVFRYISDEKLKWAPLDNAYDRAVFGDKRFDFVTGKENLRAELKKNFPDAKDHASIDAYFKLLEEVENVGIGYFVEKALPPFLARIFGPMLRLKLLKYSDQITLDVLKTITDNEKLIGVLTAQYGDFGLLPAESSFYMHALVANHYMEGGAYPVGGAANIANTVIPVIEKAGGSVLFYADVKQVIVEGNKAIGVEMADGKKIYAKYIISDAGVANTFGRLLPQAVRERHQLDEKLKQLEPSAAHMGLYIGIKDSPKNLKLPACNYWVFPDEYNHERGRANYKTFTDTIPVAYISFPSAKDPEWEVKHPGISAVEIIILLPFDWFAKWEDTAWKKRGEEYEKMKKDVADQLFEILYRVEPQLKGKVDYYEISTPLSTKKFTNHPHGEIYGVSHTPKRFRQEFLKPYTPVKNLFMTGQDVMVASIAGGLMGGVLCASAILKKDVLSTIKRVIT